MGGQSGIAKIFKISNLRSIPPPGLGPWVFGVLIPHCQEVLLPKGGFRAAKDGQPVLAFSMGWSPRSRGYLTSAHYGWYNVFRVINSHEISSSTDTCLEGPTSPKVPSEEASPTQSTPPTSIFPEADPPQSLNLCSHNKCLSGHVWPATLALAKCPGCTGSVLAVQKANCPFCNEPIVETNLRSDFLPRGAGIAARCKKQPVPGESLDIELKRTGWKEVETSTLSFLETEAKERVNAKINQGVVHESN